jgi:hypothetical protein
LKRCPATRRDHSPCINCRAPPPSLADGVPPRRQQRRPPTSTPIQWFRVAPPRHRRTGPACKNPSRSRRSSLESIPEADPINPFSDAQPSGETPGIMPVGDPIIEAMEKIRTVAAKRTTILYTLPDPRQFKYASQAVMVYPDQDDFQHSNPFAKAPPSHSLSHANAFFLSTSERKSRSGKGKIDYLNVDIPRDGLLDIHRLMRVGA